MWSLFAFGKADSLVYYGRERARHLPNNVDYCAKFVNTLVFGKVNSNACAKKCHLFG